VRRYEYYKARGVTLQVSTCACCRERSGNTIFQDAWEWSNNKLRHIGVPVNALGLHYTLITEAEARKRAPGLIQEANEASPDTHKELI